MPSPDDHNDAARRRRRLRTAGGLTTGVLTVAVIITAIWFAVSYHRSHQLAVAIQNDILTQGHRYVVAYASYDVGQDDAWRARLRQAGAERNLADTVAAPPARLVIPERPRTVMMHCDQLQFPAECNVVVRVHVGDTPALAKVGLQAPRAGVVHVVRGPALVTLPNAASSPAPDKPSQ